MLMNSEWQSRTELLIGERALEVLGSSHVLIAGLGGVGAYTAEMLCRAGIGKISLADGDRVQNSNRNRQLLALQSTNGMYKVPLMEERLQDINPDVKISRVQEFLDDEMIDRLLETRFDYVADAIDTLSPKVSLIRKTLLKGYPLVSSMGSGGRLDPSLVRIADISESHSCRFAYTIRKQLHRKGITDGFKVVFSPEPVSRESVQPVEGERNKKSRVGTISYLPPVFGCYMASVVIRDLIKLAGTGVKNPGRV
jgi:tRNA A37 threonylcarbamoyladenosine dehydratase